MESPRPCLAPNLALTPTEIADFSVKTQVSTVFLEHQDRVLILHRKGEKDWDIPRKAFDVEEDKSLADTALRSVSQDLGVDLHKKMISLVAKRFVRGQEEDYEWNIYSVKILSLPDFTAGKEISKIYWVPLCFFKEVTFSRSEVSKGFDINFRKHLWTNVSKNSQLVLDKKPLTVTFNGSKKIIIYLLGPSPSDNRMQGLILSKWLKIPYLSLSDVISREISQGTELRQVLQRDPSSKAFSTVATGLVLQRLIQPEYKNGYILDGFPSSAEETAMLTQVVGRDNLFINIFLRIDEGTLQQRMQERRICPMCRNTAFQHDLLQKQTVCSQKACENTDLEVCKQPLDTKTFQGSLEKTLPVVESLTGRIQTIDITTTMPTDEIFQRIYSIIDAQLDAIIRQEQDKNKKISLEYLAAGIAILAFSYRIFTSHCSS